MMTNSGDLRQERDDHLARAFADKARHLRSEYREWIESELKDCIFKAETVEATLAGEIKGIVQAAVQRMKEISRRELREAINNLDTKCLEIEGGASDDVIDDRKYLEEGLSRFEGLVSELLDIRRLLDGLWV